MSHRAARHLAETTANLRRIEPDTVVIERRPARFGSPLSIRGDDEPTEEFPLPVRHLRLRRLQRAAGHWVTALAMSLIVAAGGAWAGFSYATATSPTIVCPIDRR